MVLKDGFLYRLMNIMSSSHSLKSHMLVSKITKVEFLQLRRDQIARMNKKEESFNRECYVHHCCIEWKRFYLDCLLYFLKYKIGELIDRTLDEED